MTPTTTPQLPLPTLRGLDQIAHLDAPERKQQYVTTMFEIIAPAYDRFTTLFSFGMDRAWKHELVRMAKPSIASNARLLDLACGTGDLTFALAKLAPQGRILGIDAASRMIQLAQRALQIRTSAAQGAAVAGPSGPITRQIDFQVGDMCSLQVEDASRDVVSVGYGLRNVPKLDDALSEISRVLVPGGVCVCLDFTLPPPGWWRQLFLRYLLIMGNIFGVILHGEADVYGYIARSIERFVSVDELSRRFEAHGMKVEQVATKLHGGVCLLLARKLTPSG